MNKGLLALLALPTLALLGTTACDSGRPIAAPEGATSLQADRLVRLYGSLPYPLAMSFTAPTGSGHSTIPGL